MPDETFIPSLAASVGVGRRPLVTLRDAFALLVTGPAPLALDGASLPALPDRLVPLDELRDLLLARSCPQATRDAAWAEVIRRSRSRGGAWTVGAAGMALPALRAVSGSLAWHDVCDPADMQAEVLTGFLEAVATIRLDLPRIAVRLRWAAYRSGLGLLTQARESPHPDPDQFRPPAAVVSSTEGPREVLAEAVADGILTAAEADLIGTTRLGRTSVSTWAARAAIPQRTAYRMRTRAERRLTAHLTGQPLTSRPPTVAPPRSPAGRTSRPAVALVPARRAAPEVTA